MLFSLLLLAENKFVVFGTNRLFLFSSVGVAGTVTVGVVVGGAIGAVAATAAPSAIVAAAAGVGADAAGVALGLFSLAASALFERAVMSSSSSSSSTLALLNGLTVPPVVLSAASSSLLLASTSDGLSSVGELDVGVGTGDASLPVASASLDLAADNALPPNENDDGRNMDLLVDDDVVDCAELPNADGRNILAFKLNADGR